VRGAKRCFLHAAGIVFILHPMTKWLRIQAPVFRLYVRRVIYPEFVLKRFVRAFFIVTEWCLILNRLVAQGRAPESMASAR
jgi:hypothetical protein